MAELNKPESHKLKVFISYSRRNVEDAEKLVAALEAHDIDVLIDRRDLPYGEQWQNELAEFVRTSDTVVWLVSADSIASQWCNWELGEVVRLNKRLVPVKIRDVAPETLPPTLGKIHLLPAEGVFSIEQHLVTLVEVLNTDRAWIKEATRLGDRAREWLDAQRASAMLLRGEAIRIAEEWKDRQPKAAPPPSRDILELVLASRRAATTRGRRWLIGSVAMAILGFGLAGVAYWQRNIAIENEALAVANDKAANNERIENLKSGSRLVSVASQQLIDEKQPGLAQAIALEGLPDRPGDRPMIDDALKALKRGIRADQSMAVLTLGKEDFLSAAFTPDGKSLVTGTGSGKLIVWDLDTYQPRLQIQTGNKAIFNFDISPDGRAALAASDSHPEVWDLVTGKVRLQLPPVKTGFARRGQFSPDGTRIAIGYNDNHAEIRDAATGELLHRLEGPKDFDEAYRRRATGLKATVLGDVPLEGAVAFQQWKMLGGMTEVLFSPDGKILAVAGQADAEAATRLYDVASGDLLATLPGENLVMGLSLQRMSFSPDGALLAVAAADNVVRVWSVPGRKLLFALPHTAESHALIFDPSGTMLIVGYADGSVRVWSAEDGQSIATFAAHLDQIGAIAFSPAGDVFATASNDRNVNLWWNTLERDSCGPNDRAMFCDAHLHSAAVLRGHTGKIRLVTFSPDGKIAASIAEDSTLRLWRAKIAGDVSLRLPRTAPAAEASCDPPAPAAPPPSKQSGPSARPSDADVRKKAIEIFGEEAANEDVAVLRTKLRTFAETQVRQMAVKYGFDAEEAATEEYSVLREKLLARMEAMLAEQREAQRQACEFAKTMSGLAKEHRRSAHVDSRLASQMNRRVELPNGTDDVYRTAFADDGKFLLAPDEKGAAIALWDLAAERFLCILPGRNLSLNAGDGAPMVHRTPLRTAAAQCEPTGDAPPEDVYSDGPSDLRWFLNPDGTRAVGSSGWVEPQQKNASAASDEKKVLFDPVNKKVIAVLDADGRDAKTAQFSADGAIVIGALAGDRGKNIADGGQYAVWDAVTGALFGITAPSSVVMSHLGIASNGRQFVLAQDGGSAVTYYSIDEGGHLASRVMAGSSRGLSAVAISFDGSTVAAAYIDGSIGFFSSHDGKLDATLPAGIHPVTRLAFSPDARLLAGADTSRTVWLWDMASKTPMVVTSVRSEPTALKFSPAGDRLAVRTDSGEVRVLAVDLDYLKLDQPQDIVDWARASLSATLSATDRQRFLLSMRGNREADPNLIKLVSQGVQPATAGAANATETAAGPDAAALWDQATRTALAEGLPGVSHALAYALSAADGKAANAAFELGLDIDKSAATEQARELAFFYLRLGQRFAEASPAAAVDDGLRDAAAVRMRILPRQIPPRTLVALFRSARSWQAP